MTPDINVLVAAARADHPHHGVARTWLQQVLSGASAQPPLVLMPMVMASCLRLLTSPRVFREPSTPEAALAFLDALLARRGVRLASLGAEWPRLRQLCLDRSLSGNAVPDAWLAAAVEDAGEHLVSFDRNFKKLLGRQRLTLLQA